MVAATPESTVPQLMSTMDKVVERLADLLDQPVTKAGSTVVGPDVSARVGVMKAGDVVLIMSNGGPKTSRL